MDMTITYDLWMLLAACALAGGGCFAVPLLVSRLQARQPKANTWLIVAVATLGFALWAVHSTALRAMRLPVAPVLDVPLTLLSIEPVILAVAVVLWLGRSGRLHGGRLAIAVAALAAGSAAARYFGVVALHFSPAVQLDFLTFSASIAAVAGLAYAALRYGETWLRRASLGTRIGVAGVLGIAIGAAQWLGTAAARIAPNAFVQSGADFDRLTLGYGVAGIALVALLFVCALARTGERNDAESEVVSDRGFAG
jgi:NO-binding membrane sensor protein with MHYT domain